MYHNFLASSSSRPSLLITQGQQLFRYIPPEPVISEAMAAYTVVAAACCYNEMEYNYYYFLYSMTNFNKLFSFTSDLVKGLTIVNIKR